MTVDGELAGQRLLLLSGRAGVQDFCARNGVETTVVYDDRTAGLMTRLPRPATEHRVYVEHFNDAELVLSALARAGRLDFDGVCTAHEKGVALAALLAGTLARHRPLSPAVAAACRDKFHQKRLLRAHVPVADAAVLEDIRTAPQESPVGYPAVVKPSVGAATYHTYRVDDPADFAGAVKSMLAEDAADAPRTVVVERWVDGVEHKVDGWISGGRLGFFMVSRYLRNLLCIKSGGLVASVTLDPAAEPELHRATRRLLETVLPRLGLTDGVFHLEMFAGSDGLTFSECGARIGGGVTADVAAAMFGVDLHEAAVRLALGSDTPAASAAPARVVGSTFLPLPATAGAATAEFLAAQPGVIAGRYEIADGATVDITRKSNIRAGYALLEGATADEVESRVNELVALLGGTNNGGES